MFKNKWQFVETHKLITNPGKTITIESYRSEIGKYVCHFMIQSLRLSDEINIEIFYRPAPNVQLYSYENVSIPFNNNIALWSFSIPICAGFEIKISQRGGVEKQAALHIWRKF